MKAELVDARQTEALVGASRPPAGVLPFELVLVVGGAVEQARHLPRRLQLTGRDDLTHCSHGAQHPVHQHPQEDEPHHIGEEADG